MLGCIIINLKNKTLIYYRLLVAVLLFGIAAVANAQNACTADGKVHAWCQFVYIYA